MRFSQPPTLMTFLRKVPCTALVGDMCAVKSQLRPILMTFPALPPLGLQFGLPCPALLTLCCGTHGIALYELPHFCDISLCLRVLANSRIKGSPTMPLFFVDNGYYYWTKLVLGVFWSESLPCWKICLSVAVPKKTGRWTKIDKVQMRNAVVWSCFQSKPLPFSLRVAARSDNGDQVCQKMALRSNMKTFASDRWCETIKGFCVWSLLTKCMRRFRRLLSECWVPMAVFRLPCHALWSDIKKMLNYPNCNCLTLILRCAIILT